MHNDPYTAQELEGLLPPHPVGEPVFEIDTEIGDTPHHRAFVDSSGETDTDGFREPLQVSAPSMDVVIAANLKRVRKDHETNDSRWTAAATNRMLHHLTSGTLFTSPDIVSKVERGVRPVSAEELVWFTLLFEIPIWELLAPQPDEYVNLAGRIRDHEGSLLALTHLDPGAVDAMDPEAYRAFRQRQRAAEKAAFVEATETLLDVRFVETLGQFASDTGLIVREVKVPEPATPLESDERLPGETEEDYELRQNEERGVLVSEFEKLKQVGEDLDQVRIGLERAFREAQRELKNSANKLETKED